MYIDQLRSLRELHGCPGTLPRLSFILRANIIIFNEEEDFQIEELLDNLLPPLADIFCNLNYLGIALYQENGWSLEQYNESLSLKMLNRVNQLFNRLCGVVAVYNKEF